VRGLHAAFEFGEIELRQLRHLRHMNRGPSRAGATRRPKSELAAGIRARHLISIALAR
jgi:hypothetical protein